MYNDFTYEVEKLTKHAAALSSSDEKRKNIVGVFLCALSVIIVCVIALNFNLHILIPFSMFLMGGWGMVSESLPVDPNLKLLEVDIKEKIQNLDNRLLEFEKLKKNYAEYWLSMNGWRFEKEVAKLYSAHGYSTVVTRGSDDGGIDIFLTKNGARFGVQCKNHSKPVAQAVIRELAGAMLHEGLDGGVVVVSSGYTKRAKEFAENKNIRLLDINDVLKMHAATLA